MSSNIGPEARAAYQKYLDAGSLEEKIKHLEEFVSKIPKHKATEKIVALNKSRLAKMKRELEERKQRFKSTQKVVSPFSIKKEGIQIVLISDYYTPGVGKTSLLNYLTGAAKDKIGRFTALPEIGIFKYRKIRYQIVDMPSLMEGASRGVGNGKEIISQIRAADLICLCIDLSRDFSSQMDLMLEELDDADIRINVRPPPLDIQKTGSNRIQVIYLTKDTSDNIDLTEKIREIISENGIRNCIVKVYGDITLNDIVDTLNQSVMYKKAIILGTKGDLPNTKQVFKKLKNQYINRFPVIHGISVKKQNFPSNFGELVLNFLNKIKIYTMNNARVAEKPLILDKNSTVKDVALKVHRKFYELFDFAIIVRKDARQKRKKVGFDYEVEDNDIIEIHMK